MLHHLTHCRDTAMKNIFLVLVSTLLFAPGAALAVEKRGEFLFPGPHDYPLLRQSGARVADFIPKGWSTLGKASGDLNGDKLADVAIVIKGNRPQYKQKNHGPGEENFDTNPRLLVVLFKDAETRGYKLVVNSRTLVEQADTPEAAESFGKVSIANGLLLVELHSFDTFATTKTTYKFQYQHKRVRLIGAEQDQFQRNVDEWLHFSVNLLTRRMQVTTSTWSGKTKPQVRWKNLGPVNTERVADEGRTSEWEGYPDVYL